MTTKRKRKARPKNALIEVNPATHRPRAREFVDIDYADKLSAEDAAWLAVFVREYYRSNFKKRDNLHGAAQRREIYREDHAKRRDLWNNGLRMPLWLGDEVEWGDDGDE